MPNTKSAARRMRSSARRQTHNRGLKSRLRSLEKGYRTLVAAGKPDEAGTALRNTISAFDKAAKSGVIPKATADRKKSRLTVALAASKPAAKPESPAPAA